MATVLVNGLEVGKTYTQHSRPKKEDGGHSIVKQSRLIDYKWRERRSVVCECGKRFTGWGMRPYYAHTAHQKEKSE